MSLEHASEPVGPDQLPCDAGRVLGIPSLPTGTIVLVEVGSTGAPAMSQLLDGSGVHVWPL
jgi:hypothetical protein